MKIRIVLSGVCFLFFFSCVLSASTPAEDSLSRIATRSGTLENPLLYKKGAVTYFPSLSLRFGLLSTDLSTMNQSMDAATGKEFKYNLLAAGLSGNFPLHIRGVGAFDCNVDLNYMIPQTIALPGNISTKLLGFGAGFGAGMDLFPHNTNFDLMICGGFQGGMLRLRTIAQGVTTPDPLYSKPYFAPQLTVYPRFNLGAVFVGVKASYHIDVLSGNWNASSSTALPNPPWASKVTGYSIEAVFGFVLGDH
jgi:hypothetical protein